jgi:4-amino-4-deoxy-L-arabinose transferase-like glycosyltransferase
LASWLILALFIWGIGKSALFPSLRLFQDTQWDGSLFFPAMIRKLTPLLWVMPVGLGLMGWARWFKTLFFLKVKKDEGDLLGLSLALSFFSLYVFGLAVNEILYWPLTALFFIPPLWEVWKGRKDFTFPHSQLKNGWGLFWFAPPLALWAFEYFSPPLVWDAILDHYRFAREVSRLHQILFHWTNHTGDMPKAAELVLAGFWNLGGEGLSKFSSALPALLTSWLLVLFVQEGKAMERLVLFIFWTCPFFLALYSWGYIEGFLAFFEVLALFCFWKAIQEPKNKVWPTLMAFFLGTAFAVKYTAVLAIIPIGIMWVHEKLIRKNPFKFKPICFLAFLLPLFPWLLKNWLAFGNPIYPLATSLFSAPIGYSPEMERGLLADTGLPAGLGGLLKNLWDSFFTTSNAVNAAWTPLVAMSLPWAWILAKKRFGIFLLCFSAIYFAGWMFISTSFRHASGGCVVLVLMAALAWEEAFHQKKTGIQALFGVGVILSFWLCLSAQLLTTAPYAAALGWEDPLLRLKRHYSYDLDTYTAYKGIEDHSDSKDKVVAFAVFQTYPLQRIAFVDFKWKRPVFLQWASHCKTAEELAAVLEKEGVRYFLYQKWEARAMSREEKDFNLEGMPVSEYIRFWRYFMEPVGIYENSFVYAVRFKPLSQPQRLELLPGFEGKDDWVKSVMDSRDGG